MRLVHKDPYYRSLALFDRRVEGAEEDGPTIWTPSRGRQDSDRTEMAALMRILSYKIGEIPDRGIEAEYALRLRNLGEKHRHLHEAFIIDAYVWPPAALHRLLQLTERINPTPKIHETVPEWVDAVAASFPRTLQQQNVRPEQCVPDVRRVYEWLRADIGSQLAHQELLERYKTRCTVYDRARIKQLVEDSEGEVEAALTRDLALYLFDNGVAAIYRLRWGIHEIDLLSPSLAVEAKQYGDYARGDLIDGISQFHGYINSLPPDTSRNVRELYYVVFRLGGPLYDIPDKIEMQRWTIYPVIIDLGPPEESGSRQQRIRPITLDEILAKFPDEEE